LDEELKPLAFYASFFPRTDTGFEEVL